MTRTKNQTLSRLHPILRPFILATATAPPLLSRSPCLYQTTRRTFPIESVGVFSESPCFSRQQEHVLSDRALNEELMQSNHLPRNLKSPPPAPSLFSLFFAGEQFSVEPPLLPLHYCCLATPILATEVGPETDKQILLTPKRDCTAVRLRSLPASTPLHSTPLHSSPLLSSPLRSCVRVIR